MFAFADLCSSLAQIARQSAAAAAAQQVADEAARAAAERARLDAEAAAAEDAKLKAAGPRLVGDGGAAWRRKALLRATEQAKEAGVSVEEFVKDRWGVRASLGVLDFASSVRSAICNKCFFQSRGFNLVDCRLLTLSASCLSVVLDSMSVTVARRPQDRHCREQVDHAAAESRRLGL